MKNNKSPKGTIVMTPKKKDGRATLTLTPKNYYKPNRKSGKDVG